LKAGTERHTEEYILRELFRAHDRDSNGVLSRVELSAMMGKLGINASDKYLDALISRMDSNKNGVIEFEEFLTFVVHSRYTKA
jgi:Ca2+-binding EF-hand superfamily protein